MDKTFYFRAFGCHVEAELKGGKVTLKSIRTNNTIHYDLVNHLQRKAEYIVKKQEALLQADDDSHTTN